MELGSKINFAGHLISDEGIQPNENKYASVSEFPTPKNLKDLRAFLGLAIQLASFVPDLAHMTSTLRPLLKKGNAWLWLDEHEKAFKRIIALQTAKTIIHPFDPKKPTTLLTDASRLHGLGFALMQDYENASPKLIQCRSPITDTTKICNDRARMPGYTMGGKKMRLLPKGITRFQNPD